MTKDHGRLEIRTCQVTDDPAILTWLDPKREWRGLRSIAAVTTCETRYFVSSLPDDAGALGGSRTACTGFWTSHSGKMIAASEPGMPLRIWPGYGISP